MQDQLAYSLDAVCIDCQVLVAILAWHRIVVPNSLYVLAISWGSRVRHKDAIKGKILRAQLG